jgi:hypothetical protein
VVEKIVERFSVFLLKLLRPEQRTYVCQVEQMMILILPKLILWRMKIPGVTMMKTGVMMSKRTIISLRLLGIGKGQSRIPGLVGPPPPPDCAHKWEENFQ